MAVEHASHHHLSVLASDLEAVVELVNKGPCHRAAARDADGNSVAIMSPTAVCFCPVGAAMRLTRRQPDGDWRYMQIFEALDSHARILGATCLASWVDSHSHDEIVRLCRYVAGSVGRAAELDVDRPRALAIMDSDDNPIYFGDEILAVGP